MRLDGCEVNLLLDPENCNECGHVCSTNHISSPVCLAGSCETSPCDAGFFDCNNDKTWDGCETDAQNDPFNCGGCNRDCSTQGMDQVVCSGGSCESGVCDFNFADCNNNKRLDGCEASLQTDIYNCGSCGFLCNLDHQVAQCVNGVCGGTCSRGWGDCDNNLQLNGCESSLLSDLDHCGSCGNSCFALSNANVTCQVGECAIEVCQLGYGDCNALLADGCELDLTSDSVNCGVCGRECSDYHATPTCSGSICVSPCENNYADCNGDKTLDGCEVYLLSNVNNCGACGYQCQPMEFCFMGSCTSVPPCELQTTGNATEIAIYASNWGTWFTDFADPGQKYWTVDGYLGCSLREFSSLSDLTNQINAIDRTLSFEGTNHLVYDGMMYVQALPNPLECTNFANPGWINVVDTTTWQIVRQITIPNMTPIDNGCSYSWGGYSCIDMAVDVGGRIYAIVGDITNPYGYNSQTIYEIDGESGLIIDTQQTSSPSRGSLGDCWIMCRRMYCTESYVSTTVEYIWDMGTEQSVPVFFPQQFGMDVGIYTTAIQYSPNEGARGYFYNWNDHKLLRYTDIEFVATSVG